MKTSKTVLAAAFIALCATATAHAQMVKYRVDLKAPGQFDYMTVATMLVGQKGTVAKSDVDGHFTLSVESKSVTPDGAVNSVFTYDWKNGSLEKKDTISVNLKPGEAKELFSKSGISATVTLQK